MRARFASSKSRALAAGLGVVACCVAAPLAIGVVLLARRGGA